MLKNANGLVRVEKQVGQDVLVYTSAVKPGSRFVDEQSVLHLDATHGVRLVGNSEQVMRPFLGMDRV